MKKPDLKVLIVDHDSKMNSKLRKFLRSRGFATQTCESQTGALTLLHDHTPDVVMVDTELREGSALELCYALHKVHPKPQIVLLVSSKTEFEALDLFEAQEQLLKPFMGKQILVLLQSISRRLDARRSNSSQARLSRPVRHQKVSSGSTRAKIPDMDQSIDISLDASVSMDDSDDQSIDVSIDLSDLHEQDAPSSPKAIHSNNNRSPIRPARNHGNSSGNHAALRTASGVLHTDEDDRPPSTSTARKGRLSNAADRSSNSRSSLSRSSTNKPAKIPNMGLQGRVGVLPDIDVEKASRSFVGSEHLRLGRPDRLRTVMHQAGRLEKIPFPALLYKLFANQSTGVMTLLKGDRTLYFLKGEPVHAVSDVADESLSAILTKLGYVGLDSLNEALGRLPPGRPVGQFLLDRKLLSGEQLLHALDRQVYERVLGCFSLNDGQYIFIEEEEWMGEVRRFPQNPIQLISDGIERFVGPNILAEQLQDHLQSYVVRTEKFAYFESHFPSMERHQKALSLLDGTRTLQQLTVEASGDLMALLRLVWSLRSADMIDFLDAPRTTAERSASKPPLPRRAPTDPNARVIVPARPTSATSQGDPNDAKALEEVVMSYYMRLGYDDNWALLGVSQEADADALRTGFRASLDKLPPEKFGLLPETVREKAEEVLQAFKHAYNTLSQPKQRERYRERLKARQTPKKTTPPPNKAVAPPSSPEELSEVAKRPQTTNKPRPRQATTQDADAEAELNHASMAIKRAKRAASKGMWKEAWHALKIASQRDPYNGDINVFQAWIAYNLPHKDRPRQYKVCRHRIKTEIDVGNRSSNAFYFLGKMEEDQRNIADAMESYHNALMMDDNHQQARQAAARLARHPSLKDKGEPMSPDDPNLIKRLKSILGK